MRLVCTRLPGSITTSCAYAGVAAAQSAMSATTVRRIWTSLTNHRRGRQLDVTGQIDLYAVPFTNRDRRHPVQKPVHRLRHGLARRVRDAAADDDRVIRALG